MISTKLVRATLWSCVVRPFSAVPAKAVSQSIGKKRFRVPTEKNVDKLVNYCCGANYLKEGEEIPLKDDSHYPQWLWDLPLKPPKLHELDPNTKEYWEKAEIVGRQRELKLRSITNKRTMVVSERMIKNLEVRYRRRFRALAKYHYNAGHEIVEHHEREDIWNMHEKEALRLPDSSTPFYPGIDQLDLPQSIKKMSLYRKRNKVGHFGQ